MEVIKRQAAEREHGTQRVAFPYGMHPRIKIGEPKKTYGARREEKYTSRDENNTHYY